MKNVLNQIMKQLWVQRRSNAWLFLQMMIIFVVMWFWVDLMWDYAFTTRESIGIDIENVYELEIDTNHTIWDDSTLTAKREDHFYELLRQVREYPGVEAVAFYTGTPVYEDNFMNEGYVTDRDTGNICLAKIRYVSEGFADVFRIRMENGGMDDWTHLPYPRPALITGNMAERLFGSREVVGQRFTDYYAKRYGSREVSYYVSGVLPPTKQYDYALYDYFIYVNYKPEYFEYNIPHVVVRVRPDMQKSFATNFLHEMKPRLRIGPYFLIGVQSMQEQKETFAIEQGHTAYLQLAYGIALFFICNVFFAIMGTFWFRTRKRRSEIGLRMAMGASRRQVHTHVLLEAFLLFSLAAIPGVVICLNMVYADLNVLALSAITPLRYIMTMVLTFVIMTVMVLLGCWAPARYAGKLMPAEALREE